MTKEEEPAWFKKATESLDSREERFSKTEFLSPEIKQKQLTGMRVFVVISEKTGTILPVKIVYGKNYNTYEEFAKSVEAARSELTRNLNNKELRLEDRWALNLEDFLKDYPDLAAKLH